MRLNDDNLCFKPIDRNRLMWLVVSCEFKHSTGYYLFVSLTIGAFRKIKIICTVFLK